MKHLLSVLFIYLISLPVFSQHYSILETDRPPKFKNECESDDTPKCFERSILEYINRNINIINLINTDGGTAYAQFIITEKGEVKDIRIRSNSKFLEKETERLLEKMKIKEPAIKDGKEVAVIYTVPVKFQKKQSNSYNDFIDEQLSQKDLAGLNEVSTPPRIKNYDASLESLNSKFRNDILEQLRAMKFHDSQIKQLKFTFVIS
ncbi:MAG: energy transducer TonB [Christiangramia sp.]|nr:energy transducer TonB [Christiangramia sp.]